MFWPKAPRVNSISEAERPKRSRVAPSEAIPTFLPYPRPEAGSDQALQGRTSMSGARGRFYSSRDFFPGLSCLVLCWYSENTFIDRDWDFIFRVIQWSSAEILLQSGYKQSPTHNHTVWLSSPLSPEFNFPALCSVRSGHCCFLRGPSVQGWQGWLPVHGWVMIIFLPPSAGHQPIRGCYQLSLTNQRPALPLLISLFCPHQSSYWWGITRTIIMLEPGQEN